MSELLTARIQTQATKLGLTNLAGNLVGLLKRAEAEQMGYLDCASPRSVETSP